jgi:hypothetical protein
MGTIGIRHHSFKVAVLVMHQDHMNFGDLDDANHIGRIRGNPGTIDPDRI